MDISHSANWAILLKFLTEESINLSHDNSEMLAEHQNANALALFLAHATLRTPVLNRENLAAILQGDMSWPRVDGTINLITCQNSLPFFEEAGFISFPGGWVENHCRIPRNTELLDPSINDILQVMTLIAEIKSGKNGYVRPHFFIDEMEFVSHLQYHIGSISLDRLFPDGIRHDGMFIIQPNDHQMKPLESSYLWKTLLENNTPERAFERWLLCVRVHSQTIVPVKFSLLDDDETTHFLDQVENLVNSAPEFNYSLKTLYKQVINSSDFAQLVQPVSHTVNMTIGIDSETVISNGTDKSIPIAAVNAETLDEAYHFQEMGDPEDINTLEQWNHRGYWQEPMGALSWLIQECIQHVIHIDHQSLSIRKFASNMLALAESRTGLKYILFCMLPQRFNYKYTLYLLSNPATCEIAIYHLISKDYFQPFLRNGSDYSELSRIYYDMLIKEYFRAAADRKNNGNLLLKMALYLADNSGLYAREHSSNFAYSVLKNFMQKIDEESVSQLASAFLEMPCELNEWRITRIRERSIYCIGVWLIERLESAELSQSDLLLKMGEYVLNYYITAFRECITSRKRDLEADAFFSSLPWESLVKIIGLSKLLKLSSPYRSWGALLTHQNENAFYAVAAIRQHLQLLILTSKFLKDEQERTRVSQRIVNVVCTLGFGNRSERYSLFNAVIREEAAELWKVFSLFLNTLPSALYDEFYEQCIEDIPLDSLYVLLDRCNVHERQQALQNEILERPDIEGEELGLASLETAFIHACDNGHMKLAKEVLTKAEPILEKFRKYKDFHFKEIVRRWEIYHYKHSLLSTYLDNQGDPVVFEQIVRAISLPESVLAERGTDNARRQTRECEQFKRYIIATAFCETEPAKTVRYMEALYEEIKNPHYAFTLFKGRVALQSFAQSKTALRFALNQFLEQIKNTSTEEMGSSWLALTLDVMMQTGDQHRADELWRKLNPDQRRTREILLPYCLGLIQRGEAFTASQIVNDFTQFNRLLSETDIGLSELLNQLSQALPEQSPAIAIAHAMAESSQRSIDNLKHHYASITNGSFENYVQITGNGRSKEIYLKDIIIEIARELLLRKNNLQAYHAENDAGKPRNRITQENVFNNWFTSFFDMRMAEARIGLRDQKIAGRSASGKSFGETDGLITDSKNRRIAIFEAFRLFSLDKAVISDHLNKIAGYDSEALNPVFIVGYCDVADFESLAHGYLNYISALDYEGYRALDIPVQIDRKATTDNLLLCSETRLRGAREITFFHLLINMHCN